jgi:hypothetical protein
MVAYKIKHNRQLWLAGAVLVFLFFGLWAEPARAQEAGFPYPLSRFKLRNGLEVIICEDSSLPLVSVVVTYAVGSINDPK